MQAQNQYEETECSPSLMAQHNQQQSSILNHQNQLSSMPTQQQLQNQHHSYHQNQAHLFNLHNQQQLQLVQQHTDILQMSEYS